MNKLVKNILKSLLLTSAMSLIHSHAKAQDPFQPELGFDENNTDEIASVNNKMISNVVKINPSGRMTMVDSHTSHRSHSSHRSHYSSRGGHSSHYSHVSSSSGTSSGSSSRRTTTTPRTTTTTSPSTSSTNRTAGFYSAPATSTVKTTYELGERELKNGISGTDVAALVNLLQNKLYLKPNSVTSNNEKVTYNTAIANAVKHFQKDAKLTITGTVNYNTVSELKAWDEGYTTVELGFRELSNGIGGYDVSELVSLLNLAGYAPNPNILENNKYGFVVFSDDISTAIKMFQAYNKLNASGKLDAATLAKLKQLAK